MVVNLLLNNSDYTEIMYDFSSVSCLNAWLILHKDHATVWISRLLVLSYTKNVTLGIKIRGLQLDGH